MGQTLSKGVYMNTVHLIDCMEFMKGVPDKFNELAIVDPPYGINAGNMTGGAGKNKQWDKGKDWDKSIPDERYFRELSRISKNQIIWDWISNQTKQEMLGGKSFRRGVTG